MTKTYSNPKQTNDLGGIVCDWTDGAQSGSEYFDPGSDLHARAEAGEWGPVAVYEPPLPPAPTPQDVYAHQESLIVAGATVTITGYGPLHLKATDKNVQRIGGLVQIAYMQQSLLLPSRTYRVRDSSKVKHDLTADQLIEFYTKIGGYIHDVIDTGHEIAALDPIPDDYADPVRWPVTEV